MNNFAFHNPTKILFGKGQIAQLAKEIPANANILLLYGGGSIKKNGVYDAVREATADFNVIEMGGIPSNPEYEVLIKALPLIREHNINFLLAVGGGSVIDGTKFIAAAAKYEGDEPWELIKNPGSIKDAMPFGSVLTLPATGSEMNSGSVITRRELQAKLPFSSPKTFPQFSVLDPEVVQSIPPVQIANGLADAFTHVLEQYATYPINAHIQDRFAESILKTLIDIAPAIQADPSDYEAAANFMWACTMALNGLISKGVTEDWAVHMIGHELTALFNIDHARTLAIIAGNHYRHNFEAKKAKLAQMAERLWNVNSGTIEEKAQAAIDNIDAFFHSLDISTKLSDYTKDYEGTAEKIAERFTERGWSGLGEKGSVTPENVAEIVKMSY